MVNRKNIRELLGLDAKAIEAVEQVEQYINELENLVRYAAWHCWEVSSNKHLTTPESVLDGMKFGAKQGWHLDATKDLKV